MSHPEEQILDAWVFGTLSPMEHKKIELHLKNCAACRRQASRLSQLAEDLNYLPKPPEAKNLRSDTLKQAGKTVAYKNRNRNAGTFYSVHLARTFACATVFLGLISGLFLGNISRSTTIQADLLQETFVSNTDLKTSYINLLITDLEEEI